MAQQEKLSILIVDDEPDILSLLSQDLEDNGYRVVQAKDGVEALGKAQNEEFSAIITDIKMPRLDGVQFIKEFNKSLSSKTPIPIIAISGDMDNFKPELALVDNVNMMEKPLTGQQLLELLDKIFNPSQQVDKEGGNPKKVVLEHGDLLMEEGDQGEVMYWLIAGCLQVYHTVDGQEIELGIIRTGELVGEMSFLDQQTRSASVRAMEPSELLIIPNGKFATILENQPGWFKSLVRTLSNRLRDTNRKIRL